ncbi:ligatin [Thecamonas trahens ATCC 50062]|uniref:Ligatin n=1 Tax=Thecamonas trahens ATCC 50062 TaxID=461836 RepID=A0A0L0DIF7_THETB|nr:ligatin [Thecamonas trahens ATCC 50062]KNC52149.1 ligatin [Thecamonas trahens ATCC 50062]|eukprot:XP_013762152.1 ligatin [Thecamonas trahens ATCC 50062]
MFRKSLETSGRARVKGAVVKKVRAALQAVVPGLPAAVAGLVLHKKTPVTEVKIREPKGVVIYEAVVSTANKCDDEHPLNKVLDALRECPDSDVAAEAVAFSEASIPLVFDRSNGKLADVVPSVYLLWMAPTAIPVMRTHRPVLDRLRGGADLMLPGVVATQDEIRSWRVGELVAVTLTEGSAAIAVGACLVDADHVLHYGMVGKAVEILHVWLDELSQLWPLGVCSLPHLAGPAAPAAAAGPEPESQPDPGAESDTADPVRVDAPDEAGPSAAPTSRDEADASLRHAFLNALKTRGADLRAALPLETSTFMSAYVVPSRAVGETVSIKASSFKNLTKFLKSQAADGLISIKDKAGVMFVVSVASASHPALASHVASRTVYENDAAAAAKAERRAAAQAAQARASALPFFRELVAPARRAESLFLALGLDPSKDAPIPQGKLTKALANYVRERELGSGAATALDANLDSALTAKARAAFVGDDGRIARKDLVRALLAANAVKKVTEFNPPYGTQLLLRGEPPKLVVTVANRGGNRRKATTVVSNLAALQLDAASLAGDLSTACAASATVRDNDLVVQGDKVDDVIGYLASEWGVPGKAVTLVDKRKGKGGGGGRGRGKKRK